MGGKAVMGFGGGAERPGVYGRGGGFAQRPPGQYNVPGVGRGNEIPGMGQPPGAERPGVYGNPGQFQPMPRGPLPDIPVDGRANLPGMGQPGMGQITDMRYRVSAPERPGVYGNPGQFQPMPRGPLPDLPGGGRGNGIPGMNQPEIGGPLPPYQGGVNGFDPNGIGTGVSGNPFTPDPNNIVRGGGSMGGNAFAGNGMRRWGNRPLLSNPNMRGL